MIQPIQTSFNGIVYRSRLEARWAVFFHFLGIEYHYEPEGYKVTDGLKLIKYLPDFLLPKVGIRSGKEKGWRIEIKPEGTENEKLEIVCNELKQPGLLLAGHSVRHDNHIQLGEFRDDSMNFRKCENCNHVSVGYGHKDATCCECGGYMGDKEAVVAANFANSYKFEFGGQLPWPTQPDNNTNPF